MDTKCKRVIAGQAKISNLTPIAFLVASTFKSGKLLPPNANRAYGEIQTSVPAVVFSSDPGGDAFSYSVSTGAISSTSTVVIWPFWVPGLNCHCLSASNTNFACSKPGGKATVSPSKRPSLFTKP